ILAIKGEAVRLERLRSATLLQRSRFHEKWIFVPTNHHVTIKAVVFDAVRRSVRRSDYGRGLPCLRRNGGLKQLGYTWHCSLMRLHEDFSVVTRESLVYTLSTPGPKCDTKLFERSAPSTISCSTYASRLVPHVTNWCLSKSTWRQRA